MHSVQLKSYCIARSVISTRVKPECMHKMLLEVAGRAQAEIRVLFKVDIVAVHLDTLHYTLVTRHACPLRKQRVQPCVIF